MCPFDMPDEICQKAMELVSHLHQGKSQKERAGPFKFFLKVIQQTSCMSYLIGANQISSLPLQGRATLSIGVRCDTGRVYK